VIAEKGKGYGRETLRLIKKFCFDQLGAHRLYLDVVEDNLRAQNLYRSEGFVLEGLLREAHKTDNGYKNLLMLSILEHER
jgi:RimJ/RimL family protein N-acetyltransferase